MLPDGRRFRSDGAQPEPVAELHVHDPHLFARLIRDVQLGLAKECLDGGWSTPHLQAVMAFIVPFILSFGVMCVLLSMCGLPFLTPFTAADPTPASWRTAQSLT